MTRYRDHRWSLAEGLATTREVADRRGLLAYLREDLGRYGYEFADRALRIEPYARDDRIGWLDTHIVTIDGFGVVGFTDGPLR